MTAHELSLGNVEVLARLLSKELNPNQIFESKKIFTELGRRTVYDSINKLLEINCIKISKEETTQNKKITSYKINDIGLVELMKFYSSKHLSGIDFTEYFPHIKKVMDKLERINLSINPYYSNFLFIGHKLSFKSIGDEYFKTIFQVTSLDNFVSLTESYKGNLVNRLEYYFALSFFTEYQRQSKLRTLAVEMQNPRAQKLYDNELPKLKKVIEVFKNDKEYWKLIQTEQKVIRQSFLHLIDLDWLGRVEAPQHGTGGMYE